MRNTTDLIHVKNDHNLETRTCQYYRGSYTTTLAIILRSWYRSWVQTFGYAKTIENWQEGSKLLSFFLTIRLFRLYTFLFFLNEWTVIQASEQRDLYLRFLVNWIVLVLVLLVLGTNVGFFLILSSALALLCKANRPTNTTIPAIGFFLEYNCLDTVLRFYLKEILTFLLSFSKKVNCYPGYLELLSVRIVTVFNCMFDTCASKLIVIRDSSSVKIIN